MMVRVVKMVLLVVMLQMVNSTEGVHVKERRDGRRNSHSGGSSSIRVGTCLWWSTLARLFGAQIISRSDCHLHRRK